MTLLSLFRHAIIATACCLSLNASAGGFTLVPSGNLSTAAPLEVKGRNGILIKQKLSFGDYHTAYVKCGWIKEWWGATGFLGVIWVKDVSGKQSIRFALTDGKDTAVAIATTRVRRNELHVGDDPNNLPAVLSSVLTIGTDLQFNNLSAALQIPGHVEPWELFLDNESAQPHRKDAAGYLRSGDRYYTIHPVWTVKRKDKTASLPFGAAGIEFQDEEGSVVAAANLMDKGAVQLLDELSKQEKLLLSTACAAVLLQSVI